MTERKSIIAPSLLSADFTRIGNAVELVERSGGSWLHLDIMDGSFVPPITFGAQMVSAIRNLTQLTLDAHLMTLHPGTHLDSFADAGVDRLTFHIEAEIHAHRLLGEIRKRGIKAGISIVPSTPVSALTEILSFVDQVLVMTVNPGWGGQSIIKSALRKVTELSVLREKGAGDYLICIDGGFSSETAAEVWASGTDVAVMGSAFFSADDPHRAYLECLPSR